VIRALVSGRTYGALQGFLGKDGTPMAALSIVADEAAAVRRKPKAQYGEGGE